MTVKDKMRIIIGSAYKWADLSGNDARHRCNFDLLSNSLQDTHFVNNLVTFHGECFC